MKNLLKVFIVEDDPIYASILKTNLSKQKDIYIKIFNSAEQLLSNLFLNPDVILLDYNLDKMNGLDALKEIKSFNPNISVIFISSQERTEVAVNSLKYGAIDYIVKNEDSITKMLAVLKKIQAVYKQMEDKKRKAKIAKMSIATLTFALVASVLYLSF